MTAFIALLCGVNVGGNRKVPMGDLREVAGELGYRDPATYIQSGNLVFAAKGNARTVESALERAMENRFGFPVEALVRSHADWVALATTNPFPRESESEASRVMMLLSRRRPKADAVRSLLQRAVDGEQLREAGGVVWAYYARGMAKTKLTPALLDRVVGSKVTARNWNTVRKLEEMAAPLA